MAGKIVLAGGDERQPGCEEMDRQVLQAASGSGAQVVFLCPRQWPVTNPTRAPAVPWVILAGSARTVFATYRVPQFSDMPALDTVLIDRRDLPSAGAGETPIICVAPAVGNAMFAATGIPWRSLPMAPPERVHS